MQTETLPGHETQTDINCPNCGRFVGALTRCPGCGTRVTKRMSVRATRIAALVLATIGLGLLYLMATHKEIPKVMIGDIKPTMNFAYVRVGGTVTGEPRLFKQGGKVRSLTFHVDDGTGEIPVTAYRAQAETLSSQNRIPRAGDTVIVAGSLAVSAEDNIALRLQVAEQLLIEQADLPVTRLADINKDLVGESVLVEGRITGVTPPKEGTRMPWSVEITDDSGAQSLSFWEDAYAEMSDKILLAPGSRIRARVSVGSYKNNLQLKLGRGQDLEFLQAQDSRFVAAPPAAPARMPATPVAGSASKVALKDISPALEGKEVLIKGRVADIKAPEAGTKAPYEVVLKDGDIEIKVVYWDTVAARLSSNKPVIGALVQVEGTVSAYKEKLQVKVSRADKVGLLDSQPASVPGVNPSEVVPIGSITPALANQAVTLRGKLGEPQSIRGGVKYPLSDESGQTRLVLWDKKVQGAVRDALKAGVCVVVSGLVVEYKGVLEVVPQSDQAIQIEN